MLINNWWIVIRLYVLSKSPKTDLPLFLLFPFVSHFLLTSDFTSVTFISCISAGVFVSLLPEWWNPTSTGSSFRFVLCLFLLNHLRLFPFFLLRFLGSWLFVLYRDWSFDFRGFLGFCLGLGLLVENTECFGSFFFLRLFGWLLFLEQVQKRVCWPDEVGMIRIYQWSFDFNQIKDHLICWIKTVVKHALHNILHSRLQLVIPLQLRQVYLKHNFA